MQNPSPKKTGKALWSFDAQSNEEISLVEGETFFVLDEPNADWLLIERSADGAQGYIPTSYAEIQPTTMQRAGSLLLLERVLAKEDDENSPISEYRRFRSSQPPSIPAARKKKEQEIDEKWALERTISDTASSFSDFSASESTTSTIFTTGETTETEDENMEESGVRRGSQNQATPNSTI